MRPVLFRFIFKFFLCSSLYLLYMEFVGRERADRTKQQSRCVLASSLFVFIPASSVSSGEAEEQHERGASEKRMGVRVNYIYLVQTNIGLPEAF